MYICARVDTGTKNSPLEHPLAISVTAILENIINFWIIDLDARPGDDPDMDKQIEPDAYTLHMYIYNPYQL